ncbi:hypothetical protein HY621_03965 [Candidatus Uhrbacteria bacterium]|nr:hypothetical protein [Candidatus Uhrbacteria bacterium]
MQTHFVGLKEFRQNISTLTKKARSKNLRYIILLKNEPVLDVRPLSKRESTLEELAHTVARARKQVKEGKVHTMEEVKKYLNL